MKFSLKKDNKAKKNIESTSQPKKGIVYLEIPNYDEDIDAINDEKELTKDNAYKYVRAINVRGEPAFQARPNEKIIIGNRDNPILGNRHIMTSKTMSERLRVIAENGKDLDEDIKLKGPMWQLLQKIAHEIVEKNIKVAFQCWCAPRPCHVDNYVRVVIEMVKELIDEHKNKLNKKYKI